jgi:glycogen synthase
MKADWSWDRSARAYVRLYQEIRRRRIARAAG